MKDKKKIAAALAAVVNYIKTDEETRDLCGVSPEPAPAPASVPRLWGINGRQTQMHFRNLMQLRAFNGSVLR